MASFHRITYHKENSFLRINLSSLIRNLEIALYIVDPSFEFGARSYFHVIISMCIGENLKGVGDKKNKKKEQLGVQIYP